MHLNRKVALKGLISEFQSSSMIKVMNLKGYSIVEEASVHETLLFKLLTLGHLLKKVDILIHFPDSSGLRNRVEELGDKYELEDMLIGHEHCMHEIENISTRFSGKVSLRYFSEPVALWSIFIWDNGVLLGWYEPETPSHKSICVELDRTSILGRHFEKYFSSVWTRRSVSAETHRILHPVFPNSNAYPNDIATYESSLRKYYGRSPSRENAFIIMIGGGAGSGKSTLAWQLAHSLGVRNVISTDMVRQLLRQNSLTEDILYDETWEAWKRISSEKTADTLFEGLMKQANLLSDTLLSLARYALSKGMPTIIEGIHILPNTEIANLHKDPRCVLFFVDTPEDQIDRNFELRKYSTHMREIRDSYASLEDRIALHDRMLELVKEADLPIVEGRDWDIVMKSARRIVTKQLKIPECSPH